MSYANALIFALAVWIAFPFAGVADSQANLFAYASIEKRNVFDLVTPPPPSITTPPPSEQPQPEIKLSGVASIGSRKRAVLMVNTKEGKSLSLALNEGERCGDLTVDSIDVGKGLVTIRFREEPIRLSFATHGNRLAQPTQAASGKAANAR